MTRILVVIAGLLVAVSLYDLVRRPILRRQALRNIVRRPGESVIMIGGALLGTAIITASFIIGDTIDGSIRDIARTNLGPIDETIVLDEPDDLDSIVAAITTPAIPEVDGVLTAMSAPGVVATVGDNPKAEPQARVHELDFDDARAFGGFPDETGFARAGPTPGVGEATMSEPMADDLGVSEGDVVELHAYGQTERLTIIEVTPHLGVAGRNTENLHVAPGTLSAMHSSGLEAGVDADQPISFVYISNVGGVFDGADHTRTVIDTVHSRLATTPHTNVDIDDWKAELLRDAELEGDDLTTIFSSIGAFAVISGILLVVNIVVMLTDERRSQLGILRALGLRRTQVVRLMGLEGTVYALAATVAGVVTGVGVGWVVSQFAARLVASDGLMLEFQFDNGSLVTGGVIGLIITLLTVWGSSIRLSRMNVIAAIRDLDPPKTEGRRRAGLVLGLLTMALGSGLLWLGVSGDSAIPAMLGVPIAAIGAVPLLGQVIGTRIASTAAGVASVVWGVGVFSFLPDALEDPEIAVFVVQGVVLVTGAVMALTANSKVWEGFTRLVGSGPRGVPIRLGLAYPLARPGRTGMLLGMFSLVLFTISFMAVLTAVFENESDAIADQTSAGFDIIVDSNRSNPVTADQLTEVSGVTSAASLTREFLDIDLGGVFVTRPVTSVDQEFLAHGGGDLGSFDPAYSSEAEVWSDVLADDTKVVIGEFLFDDDGPAGSRVDIGRELTIVGDDGLRETVTVVGVLANDWMWNGIFTGDGLHEALGVGDRTPNRHYAAVDIAADAAAIASSINGELLTHGADARAFTAEIADELAEENGFIRILQGYLGLGLLIGVAGLGIVLVRAVRERRREIGMLRAMGYRSSTIRQAFLAEALFIAGQGAIIGVALGLITAWQVVTNSDVFATGESQFVVPAVLTAVILIGPVVASLLAAMWPARRAAAITPAVALRVTS